MSPSLTLQQRLPISHHCLLAFNSRLTQRMHGVVQEPGSEGVFRTLSWLIGWVVLDLCMAASQLQQLGHVTNSMVLVSTA